MVIFHYWAPDALLWYRSAIFHGELWRVWTGLLIHSNQNHLLMNATAFVLLALFYQNHLQYYRNWLFWGCCTAVTCLIQPFFLPYDYVYGFSGINYGLLGYGIVMDFVRPSTRRYSYMMMAGLLLKTLYDHHGGEAQTENLIGMGVAHEAHILFLCTLTLFTAIKLAIISSTLDKKSSHGKNTNH